MQRRVLLGCYEVPGVGGASTVGYRLAEVLGEAGVDAHYLNLVDEEDTALYAYLYGKCFGNPRQLPNVATCRLRGPLHQPHPELTRAINRVAPDVLVGVGPIAALLLKQASPARRLVFLTTGCQQMKRLIERGETRDYLTHRARLTRGRRPATDTTGEEPGAMRTADLVVTHATGVLDLLRLYFPQYSGKIWPEVLSFSEWILADARPFAHLARPFGERDVDVLFVASAWSRPEKSYGLLRRIVARLPGARVHVVGDVESPCPGAVHHGFLADRSALFALLGRAKALVCPSAFDAAPGVLWEAAVLGCNVVASPNCGNWQLCHPDLVACQAHPDEFVRAIRRSLARKYPDNFAATPSGASTRRLLDLLAVV